MKLFLNAAACALAVTLMAGCTGNNARNDMDRQVEKLLSKMTLHEKIGQMTQYSYGGEKDSIPPEVAEQVKKGEIGSFLNIHEVGVSNELQSLAVNNSRLHIPLLIARDVIHGFRTMFPVPLGQAASWNPQLVQKAARISAIEASAEGIRWTFAPMLDVAHDPRWGRIAESCGEDPYLISKLGVAMIRGYQTDNLADSTALAACGKHFVGYGAAEQGIDYNTTWIPEVLLRDLYLVPFHEGVKNGLATIMSAFNDLNGIPASGNPFTLRQVLRKEWKFDGVVVSDYTAMLEMINHGYCADEKEVAYKAIMAGVDMEMVSTTYSKYLEELVKEKKVPEKLVDDAVRRILKLKFKLGLFQNAFTAPGRNKVDLQPGFLATAQQLATQSMVLLKNDNQTLPLKKNIKSIAVIGPLADSPVDLMGCNVADGQASDSRTPLFALRQSCEPSVRINYAQGLKTSRTKDTGGFREALDAARRSDIVILFLGEEAILSGEARSRAFLDLPGAQEDLVRELAKAGKPMLFVIMAGRPLVFNTITPLAQSVIYSFHPGIMGGPAIADILLGKAVPSGRLPVTFPRTVGQVPIYYNHMNTGRPPTEQSKDIPTGTALDPVGYTAYQLDVSYTPEYPFGYGLSYTTFSYSDLKLSSPVLGKNDSLVITASLSNTGEYDGTEIAQLYIRDIAASVTQPVKELKGFQRLDLKKGQKVTVRFVLHPEDLAMHNDKMQWVTEPGKFYLWVGGSSDSGLKGEFEYR